MNNYRHCLGFAVVSVLISLLTLSANVYAGKQHLPSLAVDDKPVSVTKLASDANSSQFLVVVQTAVKPHYHASHSETVYVISGEGQMQLGDETFAVQAGDFVQIPQGVEHAVTVTSKTPLKALSVQAPEFFGNDRIFVEPQTSVGK